MTLFTRGSTRYFATQRSKRSFGTFFHFWCFIIKITGVKIEKKWLEFSKHALKRNYVGFWLKLLQILTTGLCNFFLLFNNIFIINAGFMQTFFIQIKGSFLVSMQIGEYEMQICKSNTCKIQYGEANQTGPTF